MNQSATDNATNRLVSKIMETNLVALDKTISAVRAKQVYGIQAARVGNIRDKIIKAVYEIGKCLPPEQRTKKW